ncbi:MAG: hypothetical protein EA339_06980 [Rhodobacteraceae bacterium]|nr:MAG: hypothetical protein EA339_06980 [Paracoccaceae bacterium]
MVIACLLLSVISGLIAAVYLLIGGAGLLAALAGYSLVGSCVLVLTLTAYAYMGSLSASVSRADQS